MDRAYRWCSVTVVLVGLCALVPYLSGEDAELPIKGMRLPLELFEDGRIKMQFSAEQAHTPGGGAELHARGAVVEEFTHDGRVALRMEAETCRYNRTTGRIHSRDAVRMDRPDMDVTGVGMDWNASKRRLRLHADVRVVLKGRGLGKVLPLRPGAAAGADDTRSDLPPLERAAREETPE